MSENVWVGKGMIPKNARSIGIRFEYEQELRQAVSRIQKSPDPVGELERFLEGKIEEDRYRCDWDQ